MKKVWNILFWIVIAVVLAATAYKLYDRYKPNIDLGQIPQQQPQEQGPKGQESPKAAAPDFTLEDIRGNKINLSDYRGKIVFLNFWATWCPYCVSEMPDLEAAHIELSKTGDGAVLTVDVQESLEKVKKFVDNKKLTLPVLMDYNGRTAGLYGVSSFPTTLVINTDGTIYGYHTGPLTKTQILNLTDKIKQESGY